MGRIWYQTDLQGTSGRDIGTIGDQHNVVGKRAEAEIKAPTSDLGLFPSLSPQLRLELFPSLLSPSLHGPWQAQPL